MVSLKFLKFEIIIFSIIFSVLDGLAVNFILVFSVFIKEFQITIFERNFIVYLIIFIS